MPNTRLDKAIETEKSTDILARRTSGIDQTSQDVLDAVLAKEAERDFAAGKTATAGDVLTSPGGIATGIAALLSAAFGGQGGQEAALGLVSGFAGAAPGAAAQKQAGFDKQTATAQKDLDAARNALNMVYQANPESFLDATGEMTVDSTVLGYALTGLPISVSPSSELKIKTRNDTRLAQMTAAHTAFVQATDADGRVRALNLWNSAGSFGWSTEDTKIMAGAESLDDFFMKLMPYSDISTVLDAILKTSASGITDFADERLVPIFDSIAARALKAGGKVPQKWEIAGTQITKWVLEDLQNRGRLTPAEQAEQALAFTPDLLIEYQSRFNEELYPDAPITIKEYTELYSSIYAKALAMSNFNPEIFKALVDSDWAIEGITTTIDQQVEALTLQRETASTSSLNVLYDYSQEQIADVLGSDATPQDYLDVQDTVIKVYGLPLSDAAKRAEIDNFLKFKKQE